MNTDKSKLNVDGIFIGGPAQMKQKVMDMPIINKLICPHIKRIINTTELNHTSVWDVYEKCIDLIARHQPMAVDLRYITTGMKVNAELERIADLAVDIAQRSLQLADKPLLKPLVDIPKLSAVAQKMVADAIGAFVNKDASLAKEVVLSDSEADKLRHLVQEELVKDYMMRDLKSADRAVPLLLVARHLERICDHATNIAEDIIYMVEARIVRHHLEEL